MFILGSNAVTSSTDFLEVSCMCWPDRIFTSLADTNEQCRGWRKSSKVRAISQGFKYGHWISRPGDNIALLVSVTSSLCLRIRGIEDCVMKGVRWRLVQTEEIVLALCSSILCYATICTTL